MGSLDTHINEFKDSFELMDKIDSSLRSRKNSNLLKQPGILR